MPANRVVANLGRITEQEAENLRITFRANKMGLPVVIANDFAERSAALKPLANLVYLPIAVGLDVWNQWQLSDLVDELVDSALEVPFSSSLASLVLQRCIEPDSKLAAVDWFPTTALPELLDVQPRRFNNTRIHRTLELLEEIDTSLQQRLTTRISADRGCFVTLFLDCTDTWFVGRGPSLASKRRTKEALIRNRIGIALMCDERGYPLRWATVAGNHNEGRTMLDMVKDVADLPWSQGVPIVMDRAMGCEKIVQALTHLGVRFVTALPATELSAYSSRIPLGGFDDVALQGDDDIDVDTLAERACELGFAREQGDGVRYLLDLGVFAKGEGTSNAIVPANNGPSRAQAAIRVAHQIAAEVEHTPLKTVADRLDVSTRLLTRWNKLNQLAAPIVERIMNGEADRATPEKLQQVARLPENQQEAAFDEICRQAGDGAKLLPTRQLATISGIEPLTVRGVVVFNPRHFLNERRKAQETLDKIHSFVDDLNTRLSSPISRRTKKSVLAAVGAELRRRGLLSIFSFDVYEVRQQGRRYLQTKLTLDEEAWQLRRGSDGINVIITDTRYVGSPSELVRMYFGKDKIEKDFRIIKSVLELRPINHHTDPKVRAHVCLCVLALLLERTLERRLAEAGVDLSASSAFTALKTCHLNQFAQADLSVYTTTHATPDQQRILAALGLDHLVEDLEVAARLRLTR